MNLRQPFWPRSQHARLFRPRARHGTIVAMGAQSSSPDNAAAQPPSANSPRKSPFTNVPLWLSQRVTSTAAPQSPATASTSSVTQAGEQSGVEEEGSEGSEGKEQQGHGDGHSDGQDSCSNADWPSHQPEGSMSPCPSEFLPTASMPSHSDDGATSRASANFPSLPSTCESGMSPEIPESPIHSAQQESRSQTVSIDETLRLGFGTRAGQLLLPLSLPPPNPLCP
jgi:hypothetical protein